MPVRRTSIGVGSVNSSTFFPRVPVEVGRARGVASLTLIGTGTSGVTTQSNLATTNDGATGRASGLTVNITAAGGVATAIAVGNAAGTGYQIGDIITVTGSGGSTAVTASVASLTG